jgi:hypothetical protein
MRARDISQPVIANAQNRLQHLPFILGLLRGTMVQDREQSLNIRVARQWRRANMGPHGR